MDARWVQQSRDVAALLVVILQCLIKALICNIVSFLCADLTLPYTTAFRINTAEQQALLSGLIISIYKMCL